MTPATLCLTTVAGCFIGSIVPFINTEIIVLGAAAAAPSGLAMPLIVLAAASQMSGKAFLYLAGSGCIKLPPGRLSNRVHAAVERVKSQPRGSDAALFVSASVGLPPFYLTSIASGVLGLNFRRFMLIGFTGRTLRFAAIALVPQIIRSFL